MKNPFTDEYMAQEVKFYGLEEPYNEDGIFVKMQKIAGRCDDYLNKNFRILEDFAVPTLFVDNKLWMSITWMEVQSAFLAIKRAKGDCATAGCGLGYYILKIMEKPEVNSIDVYEIDQRIVDFFKNTFSHRKGFEKVNFIIGDVRKKMHDKYYDHVFMDIYPMMFANEVPEDFNLFTSLNEIKDYHWWCQEKAILAAFIELNMMPTMTDDERQYFRYWFETPVKDAKDIKLVNLYHETYCEKYIVNILELMERI